MPTAVMVAAKRGMVVAEEDGEGVAVRQGERGRRLASGRQPFCSTATSGSLLFPPPPLSRLPAPSLCLFLRTVVSSSLRFFLPDLFLPSPPFLPHVWQQLHRVHFELLPKSSQPRHLRSLPRHLDFAPLLPSRSSRWPLAPRKQPRIFGKRFALPPLLDPIHSTFSPATGMALGNNCSLMLHPSRPCVLAQPSVGRFFSQR